jgi:hypothetical protein
MADSYNRTKLRTVKMYATHSIHFLFISLPSVKKEMHPGALVGELRFFWKPDPTPATD